LKAGALRDVKVGDFDIPALGSEFAGEKAGQSAFAHAALLGNDRQKEGHSDVPPNAMVSCEHDTMTY
jgi:hypothetical protein